MEDSWNCRKSPMMNESGSVWFKWRFQVDLCSHRGTTNLTWYGHFGSLHYITGHFQHLILSLPMSDLLNILSGLAGFLLFSLLFRHPSSSLQLTVWDHSDCETNTIVKIKLQVQASYYSK